MSGFSAFMKENKKVKENVKYVATTSIADENGNSPEWEFKQISSKENGRIRNDNMIDTIVKGKKGAYRQRLDTSGYIADLIVASTVVPNLYDEELQNSYGVKNPKDLLYAMVDNRENMTIYRRLFRSLTAMVYLVYVGNVLMPVTPEKITRTVKGNNEEIELISGQTVLNLGEPGLTEWNMDFMLPKVQYPFVNIISGSQELRSQDYYLTHFNTLMGQKKPFNLMIIRTKPNGIWDLGEKHYDAS